VLGTDIAVTVFYVLTVLLFQKGSTMVAGEEFKSIIHFVPKSERTFLIRFRRFLDAVSWTAYLVGAISPTVAALTLDKVPGPLLNGEYITILTRNLFIVVWSSFSFGSQVVVLSRFEHMIENVQNTRTAEAVVHMRDANKSLVKLYFIISLIYTLFCIPSLWGFQTYAYGTIVFFGTFRSPAKAFKTMRTFTTTTKNKSGGGTDPEVTEGSFNPASPAANAIVAASAIESFSPATNEAESAPSKIHV
jgi:hypothetical protein